MEMCVPYLQCYYAGRQMYIPEKIANKMTATQAILISRDLTPCMLLPGKPFQQCRTYADTSAALLCEGLSQRDSPLSLLSSLLLS